MGGNKEAEVKEPVDTSAWEELGVSAEIQKALAIRGFSHPTKIQTLTIPPAIREQRDILGAAETGSGKTLAFGIPIVQGIAAYLAKKNAAKEHAKFVEDKRRQTQEGKRKRDALKRKAKDEDMEPEEEEEKDCNEDDGFELASDD